MATLISNFTESDLNKANTVLAQGWSLGEALNWSVAAYDSYLFYKITTPGTSSATQISGTLSNGDRVVITGTGLTAATSSISQIDYTFVKDGVTVSLFGNLTARTGVTEQTGVLNKFVVSAAANGVITVLGVDDVAVAGARTITSATLDLNGVQFTTTGNLSATTSIVNGEYSTSLSGNYTSSSLTTNGHNLQLSNLNVAGSTELISTDNLLANALAGDDVITGSSGNDYLAGFAGNDSINAGSGLDTVVFNGVVANYTIAKSGNDFTVSAKAGADGVDTLVNVERLQFDDTSIALDINGLAGQAYRIYQAAFDRKPDLGGLGFWINALDQGTDLLKVAANFISSAEFKSIYGNNVSNESLVTRFYANVLHRAPEKAGFDFWVGVLNSGATNAAEVLKNFSESPENQLQVIGQIQNGIEYTAYLG
ncbi:MAG: DUF4214 domain-containing protein [Burkholderiaceae bacterium]|nr:DUF4214 domain-containing protein [Burkholderiaceae bacterium]